MNVCTSILLRRLRVQLNSHTYIIAFLILILIESTYKTAFDGVCNCYIWTGRFHYNIGWFKSRTKLKIGGEGTLELTYPVV